MTFAICLVAKEVFTGISQNRSFMLKIACIDFHLKSSNPAGGPILPIFSRIGSPLLDGLLYLVR